MSEGSSEQLRMVVSLLQQLLQQQQKETAYREEVAKSFGTNRPDWESSRKDHERRMEEIKREGEQRRQEDIAFREEFLGLLRQLSETLPRLASPRRAWRHSPIEPNQRQRLQVLADRFGQAADDHLGGLGRRIDDPAKTDFVGFEDALLDPFAKRNAPAR